MILFVCLRAISCIFLMLTWRTLIVVFWDCFNKLHRGKNIKNFQTTSHNKINLWPIFSHYSLNFSDSFNVSIWEFYFHVMHVTTICGIHLNISHSLCFIFCLSRSKNRMKCEKKWKENVEKNFRRNATNWAILYEWTCHLSILMWSNYFH